MPHRVEIQEHIFVLFMLGLAFLYRQNPGMVYPHVLILLFVLLTYNFAQHRLLRHISHTHVFHAFSMIANALVLGAVMHYSGGKDSSFWVLLLMPLFSSVLMHNLATMWLTLALVLTVLGTFYLHLLLEGNNVDLFVLGTKTAVLILAFLVTKRLAVSERRAQAALEEERRAIKGLEEEVQTVSLQTDKMASLGHLTASIAHDLNGPIAVIIGYTDFILADLPPQSKHAPDVRHLREAAQFCRNLISNILGLARREDYHLVPTSIRDVFNRTWKLCEAQFRHRKVGLVSQFDDKLPEIPMSPVHIQQVMLNLLTNACHAAPAESTVTIGAWQGKNGLAVSVQDQGPGLPTGHEKDIFRPFFTSKGKGEGTGIGLNIAKQIIERHHGRIRAENAPKGGAIFTFTLPFA
ncbi:MAG: HAMP domain-containing sensor histidine kinase [Elusimicrobiota bacterium]